MCFLIIRKELSYSKNKTENADFSVFRFLSIIESVGNKLIALVAELE